METDWSVEIGDDLPRIEVPWSDAASGLSFVDLRSRPDAVAEIGESIESPALWQALSVLNQPSSPVFTSKCDLWFLSADEIDPLDFGLLSGAGAGSGCYLDVLLRDQRAFVSFAAQELWMRELCAWLSGKDCSGTRAEFVLRPATQGALDGFALTSYVLAAGENATVANDHFSAALELVSMAMRDVSTR